MKFYQLSIARAVQETAQARSFEFALPDALREIFAYQAGQFLTFRFAPPHAPGAETLLRCYSLCSAPGLDALPQVAVKCIPEGRVSNWMNRNLQTGGTVHVLPPAGRFVLRESEAPLLLFGAGSGITPLLSLLKTALAKTPRRVRLFYANRNAEEIIFRKQLAELCAAHTRRLEVRHHLDSESGFARAADFESALAGFEAAHMYLCGPAPFMALAEQTLVAREIPRAQIFIERFESPADGETPAEVSAAVAPAAAAPAAGAPAEITIRLRGKRHRVPYKPGMKVLQAARAAGLAPPFACEEGYCGSCAAKKLQGALEMENNDVFDEEETTEGWVLTCQAKCTGPAPVEIDYDA